MPKNKIGIQFDGLERMIKNLESANVDVRKAIDEALVETKKHINAKLERDTINSNFPARGKYSAGTLKKSIDKEYKVEWAGMIAEIKVGYDFNKSGLESIFMLYGTPRHKPAKKLKNDIYGSKTKKELAEVQQKALTNAIERATNGR